MHGNFKKKLSKLKPLNMVCILTVLVLVMSACSSETELPAEVNAEVPAESAAVNENDLSADLPENSVQDSEGAEIYTFVFKFAPDGSATYFLRYPDGVEEEVFLHTYTGPSSLDDSGLSEGEKACLEQFFNYSPVEEAESGSGNPDNSSEESSGSVELSANNGYSEQADFRLETLSCNGAAKRRSSNIDDIDAHTIYYDPNLEGVETQSDYFTKEETDTFGSEMGRSESVVFILKQLGFGSTDDDFKDDESVNESMSGWFKQDNGAIISADFFGAANQNGFQPGGESGDEPEDESYTENVNGQEIMVYTYKFALGETVFNFDEDAGIAAPVDPDLWVIVSEPEVSWNGWIPKNSTPTPIPKDEDEDVGGGEEYPDEEGGGEEIPDGEGGGEDNTGGEGGGEDNTGGEGGGEDNTGGEGADPTSMVGIWRFILKLFKV